MKEPWPWFREFPACWVGDPSRLAWTLEQHGAIAVLRRYAWLSEATAVREADLATTLHVKPAQLRRLLPAIEAHFTREGDWLVDAGLRDQKAQIEKKSEKAAYSAKQRHNPSRSSVADQRPVSDRTADALPSEHERTAIRSDNSREHQQQQSIHHLIQGIAARRQA